MRWIVGTVAAVVVALAVLTGLAVHGVGIRQAAADALDRVRVEGTVVATLPGAALEVGPQSVEATWTAPDGSPRSGPVAIAGPQPAGTPVAVWIDSAGEQTSPPIDVRQAVVTAIVVGLLVLFAGALLTIGVRAAILARCAAANHAAWGREWARYEPVWSRR